MPADELQRSYRVMLDLTRVEYEILERAAGDEPPDAFVRRALLRLVSERAGPVARGEDPLAEWCPEWIL